MGKNGKIWINCTNCKNIQKNQFSTIFSPFLTPPPNVFDKVIYNYKKKLFFFFFWKSVSKFVYNREMKIINKIKINEN